MANVRESKCEFKSSELAKSAVTWIGIWAAVSQIMNLDAFSFQDQTIFFVFTIGMVLSVLGSVFSEHLQHFGSQVFNGILNGVHYFFTGTSKLDDRLDEILQKFFTGTSKLDDRLDEILQKVDDIDSTTQLLRQQVSAQKLFFFDRLRDPLLIIYSYLPVGEKTDSKERWKGDSYAVRIPTDEALFVFLASHWAFSSMAWYLNEREIQTVRSLPAVDEEYEDADLKTNNLVLVGSDIYNRATKEVQTAAEKRGWLQFVIEESEDDWIGHHKKNVWIRPARNKDGRLRFADKYEPDDQPGKARLDYALLTRIPNPLQPPSPQPRTFAIIAAGCHRAGQKALTKWLSNPHNIGKLIDKHREDYFQVVLSVKYTVSQNHSDSDPQIGANDIEEKETVVLECNLSPAQKN